MTGSPGQYGRANGMGIDAIMEKPIDLALLIKAIRSFLSETRRQRVHRLTDHFFMTRNLTAESVVRETRQSG